jgi:deoxyribodipyrimidine photo-lyase
MVTGGRHDGGQIGGMEDRVRVLNDSPPRSGGDYVLYWAQMNRRVDSNHALAHACQLANELGLPVLFYEGLTFDYPCANDRLHTFILEGVPDTARRLAQLGIGYCFYLRRGRTDPNDALYRLAARAALVVTDDYPTFIAARHNASVPARIGVAMHAVDSSCVVPLRTLPKREYAAYTIRPKIHRALPKYLHPAPKTHAGICWTAPAPELHVDVTPPGISALVASCEIDHTVQPSGRFRGGAKEAHRRLRHFVQHNLQRYAEHKNEPSAQATSNLSPYLHFGMISSLEVALEAEPGVESFLEELIVRRELSFNYAASVERPELLDNLPDWARKTLAKHADDPRSFVYTRDEFEDAQTHDELWNACQRELRADGVMHGYYRMYWGKKIIEWSRTVEEAAATMVYLHDRWALDGRDPNTYAGILWCFGLHDRPWGERPIFGMVRYMSLEGMKRKTDVPSYVRRF